MAQRAVRRPELELPTAIVESKHQFGIAFNVLWDEEDIEVIWPGGLQFGRNTPGVAETARGALASADQACRRPVVRLASG